jgi:hypothetical protein
MPLYLLESALQKLVDEDADLFAVDINERSITHRLAVHLTPLFPAWDVDCKYNRNGHEPKRLGFDVQTVETNDVDAKTVYPDVIVHQRGTDHNLLVVEAKKANNAEGTGRDIRKLEAFVDELGYQYAAAVVIDTGTPPDYHIEWQYPAI